MSVQFLEHFNHLLGIGTPQYLIYCETGGRGSGKTQQIAYSVLLVGASYKRRIFSMRREEVKIKVSSYTELKSKVDNGLWVLGWKYDGSKFWNTKTGSTIEFIGANDISEEKRETLKGLSEADIIWIDEAQTLSMAALNVLVPLLGRTHNSCAIFSYNRISEKLPVEEKFGLLNKNGLRKPPNHVHFNESHYTQNPLLPKGFFIIAEDEKQRFPESYERVYNNNPMGLDDNKIVKNWSAENIADVEYNPILPIHITCDFNFSPNCWELGHKDNKKAFFFDEFCHDMYTGDLIEVVLDKYSSHNGLIVINGDASGDSNRSSAEKTDFKLIKNALIKRGFREECKEVTTGKRFRFDLLRSNGSRRKRFNAWNNKVLSRDKERCIIVSPKCEYLIYNCEELRCISGTDKYDEPNRSKIKQDPKLKYLGHPYDAASYLVNYYWHITEDYEEPPETTIDIVTRFKSHR